MEGEWREFYENESVKEYFKELQAVLEREQGTYNPSKDLIFRAFELTRPNNLRVIIIGKDPHPDSDKATGISFSLPYGMELSPNDYSINVIFNALEDDYEDFQRPNHGCLESWAKQGVLLINSVLTYRWDEDIQRNAHLEIGWQKFIENFLKFLSSRYENLVFMLWGRDAQENRQFIDEERHRVMTGYHPAASRYLESPITQEEFISKKYFFNANNYLQAHRKLPIHWQI